MKPKARVRKHTHTAHIGPANKKIRVHWPRRVALFAGVFILGVIIHYTIEHTHLKAVLQSAELTLAALFDAVWGRVEEV